jgi:hypothetical protein
LLVAIQSKNVRSRSSRKLRSFLEDAIALSPHLYLHVCFLFRAAGFRCVRTLAFIVALSALALDMICAVSSPFTWMISAMQPVQPV